MALVQTLKFYELLDSARVRGTDVKAVFDGFEGVTVDVETVPDEPPAEPDKTTDFVTIRIPGTSGRTRGGQAPTTGIIGRCGAIGARRNEAHPELSEIGMVSDADGPIAALAAALKIATMAVNGDPLPGDVIVTTHISTDAPTQPHTPVPFMGAPVSMVTMNRHEVLPEMDVILSIDASKGNRIVKQKGIAITPTIMQGYVLAVSDDLVSIMEYCTGRVAVTLPIAIQDIIPYDLKQFPRFNSIVSPHAATTSPVVGVAVTSQSVIPGSATSANHAIDIAEAAQFVVEVAKQYGAGRCQVVDIPTFELLVSQYLDLNIFRTNGKGAAAQA